MGHTGQQVMEILVFGSPSERREIAETMSDANVRFITEAVRSLHSAGRIPDGVMSTRGGMVRHFLKPRGSRRKRRQYMRTCPGAMKEVLMGMYNY